MYVYECICCHNIAIDKRNGLSCNKCGSHLIAIRQATLEDIKKYKELDYKAMVERIIKVTEFYVGHKLYQFQIDLIKQAFNK